MKNNHLLSIIVPIYNCESYLLKCLDSLINQTYRNIEIILIDDGSTDKSKAILDEYAKRDNRIKLIHKENGGVSSARNTGLNVATGDLIGFVDGDDYIDNNMFEVLISNLDKYNTDASFCGYIEHLEEHSNYEVVHSPDVTGVVSGLRALHECLRPVRYSYFTSLFNKIFKKEALLENGKLFVFPEDISIGEDETLLFHLLPKMNKVCLDNSPMYHWNIHSNSASHNPDITDKSISGLVGKIQNINYGMSNNYPVDIIEQMKGRMYRDHYHLLVFAYLSDNPKYKEIRNMIDQGEKSFYKDKDFTFRVKAKFKIVNSTMKHNYPKSIVNWFWNQSSFKYKKILKGI